MNKKLRLLVIFLITLFYLITSSAFINAQSDDDFPAAPETGSPAQTEESVPGGTRGPWSEEIVNIENFWASIYGNYFNRNFHSLQLNSTEISAKIAELNQETGINAAVVWLIPGPEYLSILMIAPGKPAIGSRVLSANQESLAQVITEFQHQISNPQSSNYLEASEQLYQWLIRPIEYNLLANKINTLILCVGPSLRSLPFAALYDGNNFLIEKFSLSLIPGFNLTQWEPINLKDAQILAMGASEFEQHPPLPGVPIELEMITAEAWTGTSALNEQFTVKNLKKELEKKIFNLVHLATHTQFKSGSVNESYIQFFDSSLSLAEMGKLPWQETEVDLLVLSGCNTARGDVKAELGFVGLGINSGVKAAIGSLWRVSDLGTLGMMNEFYWHLKQTLNPAQALRQTQLALLKGEISWSEGILSTPRGNYNFSSELTDLPSLDLSHPYFWAGFTLVGNPFASS